MLWPYVMSVIIYYLYEIDEVWNSVFLLLFVVTQLIDIGIFLTEGRIIEPTCAFVGSKMLGNILLPSLGLSQHILQVLFPPSRKKIAPSSYRFLTVATHMIVVVSALHSTECGQENNESFQALVYASILVYIFSLPVKVGGVYFIILVSSLIVLWKLHSIIYTTPTTSLNTAQTLRSGGTYCYLYAAVFLCESRFSSWVDFILSCSQTQEADAEGSSSSNSAPSICNGNNLTENDLPAIKFLPCEPSSPRRSHSPRRAPSTSPMALTNEDRQKELIKEQRQVQREKEELLERLSSARSELIDLSSPRSPPSPRCKFPVKTRGKKL